MDALPVDVSRIVLGLVDVPDVARLALTCKKWSSQIWSLQSSMRFDSADHIRALCAPPDTDTIKLSSRPRPKQLRMSSSSSSSEGQQHEINYSAVIVAAAQANPPPFVRQSANSLTSVDLSYTTLGNDSLALLASLTSLKSLNLAGSINYLLRDSIFLDIGLFTSLTALDISESQSIGYDNFFALTCLTSLEELNMSYMSTALNFEAVGMLTTLRRLDLTGNSSLTNYSLECIAGLLYLESLKLEGSRHLVGYDQTINDEGVKLLSSLSALTQLEIYHCHRVTDASLAHIASYHTKLRHLRLSHCGGISQAGIDSLASNLRILEAFEVPYCAGLKTDALQSIVNPMSAWAQTLVRVDVSGIRKMFTEGPSKLPNLPSLGKLTSLSMVGCTALRDEHLLAWLGDRQLRHLRYLEIWSCPLVTVDTVKRIATIYFTPNQPASKLLHIDAQWGSWIGTKFIPWERESDS